MSEETTEHNSEQINNENTIPGWFWAVAVIALVWNLLGLMAFVMQLMITLKFWRRCPKPNEASMKTFHLGFIYLLVQR